MPFTAVEGYIENVTITVPWQDLLVKSVDLAVNQLQLTLQLDEVVDETSDNLGMNIVLELPKKSGKAVCQPQKIFSYCFTSVEGLFVSICLLKSNLIFIGAEDKQFCSTRYKGNKIELDSERTNDYQNC